RAATAQGQFEDLEARRPLAVQDASPIAYGAFELQVGPWAMAAGGGETDRGIGSALEWGAWPRTQLEIGAQRASGPATSGGRTSGLAGLTLGALYELNAETLALPAFAFAADVVSTAGPLAPAAPLLTLGAIATRSWPGVRVHVNAAATIGPDDTSPLALDRS